MAIFWLFFYLFETHILVNFYSRSCIILIILFISYSLLVHFLFIPVFIFCSLPIHSCSFSFISFHFQFISYSLPIRFLFMFIRFFHCLWPKKFTTVPKSKWLSLINLLFKNYLFQAPNQLGYSFPIHFTSFRFQSFSKKWFIKGVVNKVWGLDG